ncbi:DUF2203 domain-containing protein [Cohnella faecalis]|uniref:DUF2203 family protein n=1 Tax=Cohnella faecalis TaxID=2315694 RepID=A0A398CJF5_9BACL|nr:DUF2203 domain-containing protein [Cohnella faecalis]RIE03456.1 DUF2203 family protein [Cohnella faecalis]
MENRTFTLDEANALLPRLKEDLGNVQALMAELRTRYVKLQKRKALHKQMSIGTEEDPFFEEEGKLDFMRAEAELLLENFKRNGVLLKSIEPGLIDFPAVLDGKDVLICWMEGEESITHYHGWHDGFAGRKSLSDREE